MGVFLGGGGGGGFFFFPSLTGGGGWWLWSKAILKVINHIPKCRTLDISQRVLSFNHSLYCLTLLYMS